MLLPAFSTVSSLHCQPRSGAHACCSPSLTKPPVYQRRCRAPRCSTANGGNAGRTPPSADDADKHIAYDTHSDAKRRWEEAERESPGGTEGFYARLGGGVASAINMVYPEETRILVMCGNGRNGAVGLRCAAALKARGFSVCVYYTAPRLPEAVLRAGVESLPFVPSTAEYYWDLCVDAVIGIGYDGGDVRESAWVPYDFVVSTSLPVVSVDVPSGWNVDSGPREIDLRIDHFVKPRLLVSLGRPKSCARQFAGAMHYLFDWEKSDAMGGKQAEPELFASNARSFMGHNGEQYGRPGMFEATLFTKRSTKRSWVYPESSDDDAVWDEID